MRRSLVQWDGSVNEEPIEIAHPTKILGHYDRIVAKPIHADINVPAIDRKMGN
jgi:hypothetical protein